MSARANYFKIGLFVISATMVAVVAIVVLGAGALFQKKTILETYIEQSVQGLDVGAAVKFRGVSLGSVEEITLVGKEYDTDERHVLVRFSVQPRGLPVETEGALRAGLQGAVEKGLRLRMASAGLTGTSYLEADYLDPKQFPPLPTDWEPKHPVIPSAPSTIVRLSESLEHIMYNLERVDLDGVVSRFEKALDTATEKVEDADVAKISDQAAQLLAEVRQTNRHVDELVQGLDLGPIMQNTSDTLAAVRRVVQRIEAPLANTVDSVEGIVTEAEKPFLELLSTLRNASQSIDRIANKLDGISADLPDDLTRVRGTLRRLDNLVSTQQQDIKVTIDNLRVVSENLKELTENAKRYPSQVLFGEPPKRLEPGR